MHLEESSCFGEFVLVEDAEYKRLVSIAAIEPCVTYTLSRDDFQAAIKRFPDEYDKFVENITQRKTQLIELLQNVPLNEMQLAEVRKIFRSASVNSITILK